MKKLLIACVAAAFGAGMGSAAEKLRIRAVQLDLARQKETVPFVKDYFKRARDAGYNTVLLYLEDRIKTAGYPYPTDAESYLPDEMRDIVSTGVALGLDLVPVVSPLGHTERFLRHPEMRRYGERCEGKGRFGPCDNPACFCLEDPEARDWMERYLTEVAALFPGGNFHMGFDEAFNLGFCTRCQPLVEKEGLAALYLEHVRWAHALAGRLGKRMWMWDDFFDFFPAEMAKVPKDVMMCCWNYDHNIEATGPRAHFGGRLRRDTLKECEDLGLDCLFCVNVWSENVRTFTEYAETRKVCGVMMTQWEMAVDFHGTFWPRVRAAASRWWGKDEGFRPSFPSLDAQTFELVNGLLIDIEKLKYRKLTEARVLNGVCETSRLNYWRVALDALRASPTRPGEGDVPADPLSEAGMIEDLAMSLELTLLCEKARPVARVLYRPERTEAESSAAKAELRGIRARWMALVPRREEMWRAWRKGCPSEKFAAYHGHLPKLIDGFLARPDLAPEEEGLLEVDLTMADTHAAPKWIVEKREAEGPWSVLASGSWKPLPTDHPYSAVLVPVTFDNRLSELRLSCRGYGAGELCHLSVRNRRLRLVPTAVVSTEGQVVDAENLLVDDLRSARFGLPDCTKTVLHPERAEKSASAVLKLEAHGQKGK